MFIMNMFKEKKMIILHGEWEGIRKAVDQVDCMVYIVDFTLII